MTNGMDTFTFQALLPDGDHAFSYTVPNLLVEHAMRNPPVPPGFWRGVNVNQNTLYMECFMDELAHAAGKDPLEFRRTLMAKHPQALAVLNAVAEKAGWDRDIPVFPADAKGKATRVTSGLVLNSIAKHVPALMGGSADLAPSNKTWIDGETAFQAGSFDQRNIHFGVREHGMGAIMNGMALHGGLIPYGATFLIFTDYMRPAIRLACLMKQHVIYVMTHDSIGLGEDGPTHQPVEQLASLRVIPNLTVIRPADANETAEAWRQAMLTNSGPTVLALSRQSLPTLDRTTYNPADGLAKGAYILKDSNKERPDAILLASGSEVHIALTAAANLAEAGIDVRVVSMPSWELFEAQPESYRQSILPSDITARVAIEAGATQGWSQYTGDRGAVIGLDHFGASAPIQELYTRFGLTAERIVETVTALLE
jgi:transketolase